MEVMVVWGVWSHIEFVSLDNLWWRVVCVVVSLVILVPLESLCVCVCDTTHPTHGVVEELARQASQQQRLTV